MVAVLYYCLFLLSSLYLLSVPASERTRGCRWLLYLVDRSGVVVFRKGSRVIHTACTSLDFFFTFVDACGHFRDPRIVRRVFHTIHFFGCRVRVVHYRSTRSRENVLGAITASGLFSISSLAPCLIFGSWGRVQLYARTRTCAMTRVLAMHYRYGVLSWRPLNGYTGNSSAYRF